MESLDSTFGNLSAKILSSENSDGENSVRQKFRSAKIPFGEISIWHKFRSTKIPFGENIFGENSFGENSFGENSGHGWGSYVLTPLQPDLDHFHGRSHEKNVLTRS